MRQIFSDFYVERDEYLGKELQKIVEYHVEKNQGKRLVVHQVIKVEETLYTAIINVLPE